MVVASLIALFFICSVEFLLRDCWPSSEVETAERGEDTDFSPGTLPSLYCGREHARPPATYIYKGSIAAQKVCVSKMPVTLCQHKDCVDPKRKSDREHVGL